jgi:hypothetical protein
MPEFPKRFMSSGELRKMGFSKTFLLQMAHRENQKYAFRSAGGGKFIYDTIKLQKEMDKMLVR